MISSTSTTNRLLTSSTAYFRSIQPDYAHIFSRPGLMVSATLYGVKLDVLSVSFSVRVFLTIGPRGYSSSVPCIGATGRKRANTWSTRHSSILHSVSLVREKLHHVIPNLSRCAEV